MTDKPNTHVVSVVAQALLMDEKKPFLGDIYRDLLAYLKKQHPELWTSTIHAENIKGWEAFKKYKNVLNEMLLQKIPGLVMSDDINAYQDIKNIHQQFGISSKSADEYDKDEFNRINNIRDDLLDIVDKHCGTLKDIENPAQRFGDRG